jgi:L-ascorbate metabolism protein UlaG (beta-lactamase superfamily)
MLVGMKLTHLGGPTALLRLGGLSLLTDPTFDEPREYHIQNRVLRKLSSPALQPADLGRVDAVLLSHDQHWDNLDQAGRDYLPTVPVTLTTPAARERLGTGTGLEPWATHELGALTVTAVPARHGPEGAEAKLGDVTGFVLRGKEIPTVYVSGDNASVELVARIAERLGPIDVAVLFCGAARAPQLIDGALTLTAQTAVEAATVLDPAAIVPVHAEGWAHYTETLDDLAKAFAQAGLTERLQIPTLGVELELR